jgi:hypothetical protein
MSKISYKLTEQQKEVETHCGEVSKVVQAYLKAQVTSLLQEALYSQAYSTLDLKEATKETLPLVIAKYKELAKTYYYKTYVGEALRAYGLKDPKDYGPLDKVILDYCQEKSKCLCGHRSVTYCTTINYFIEVEINKVVELNIKPLGQWYWKNILLMK